MARSKDERLEARVSVHESAIIAEAFAAWLDQPPVVIEEMRPLVEAPPLPHR